MAYADTAHEGEAHFNALCDRCRLIDCNSMHDLAAPYCPIGGCDMCSDLAELDAQITSVHDQLIALVRKRLVLKNKINTRHNKMNHQLPTEILSHIFNLIVASSANAATSRRNGDDKPPGSWLRASLALGVVCKRWRDVTLGTPQLWTSVVINPWTHPTSLDLTKEWLHRSGAVPLSLTLEGDPWKDQPNTDFTPLREVLRSHSNRWKYIKFTGTWKFCHEIFSDLDHVPPIDTFDVHIYPEVYTSSKSVPIRIHEPIRPKQFISEGFRINAMPMQWDNLTRLEASYMYMDEILHVIVHGNVLLDCSVQYLMDDSRSYPVPTTPIIHHALKNLKIGPTRMLGSVSDMLPKLVLPFLKTLDYAFWHGDLSMLDTLVAFLERSGPPLEMFTFKGLFNEFSTPWYERISAITHLEIAIYDDRKSISVAEEFFKALTDTIGPCILPHLRNLRLSIHWMPESSWCIFCDIFKKPQEEMSGTLDSGDMESISKIVNPMDVIHFITTPPVQQPRRPLDSVYIQVGSFVGDLVLREGVLNEILEIRKSGISLEVVDMCGTDILVSASNIHSSQ